MIHVREPLDPKISLWHLLAYQLRFMREKQELSLAQWGQLIKAARSTVSNIEAGRRKIDEDQAKMLDARWNTGRLFELLLWYARTAHNPDWFRQYTQYEAEADVIRIYQGQAIPGPLQTEDYTRALLMASNSDDIDTAVAARMARNEVIINRQNPPFVWVLLDEVAIECEIGGSEVMENQLRHLFELGQLPHVSIRLILKSTGAHLGLDGSFRIITLKSRDVAYVGAQGGGRLVEATDEVRELALQYDRIGVRAASEDASRVVITQMMEAYQ